MIWPPSGGQNSPWADRIEERIVSETSTMLPVGDRLTTTEIADLVAYLRSLRDLGDHGEP